MHKFADIFKVYTKNAVKICKELGKAGVTVLKLERQDGFLLLYTNFRDRPLIIAILTDLCYNYKIIHSGLFGKFRSILNRKGLVAGIIAGVLMLGLSQNFLFRVDVKGGFPEAEVLEVLEAFGIVEGKYIYNFDKNAVENALINIKGVASASVERIGTTLKVNILSELGEEDIYYYSSGIAVLSVCDAVVSRQIVYSGTPLLKKGDIVRKGEEVIAAYVLVGEQQVQVSARGEIYGLVYYTETVVFTPLTIKLIPSGKSERRTVTQFLGLSSQNSASPYERYYSETSVSTIGVLLPITQTVTVYYELIPQEVVRSFDDCKDAFVLEAEEKAREKAPVNGIVKAKWTTIDKVDKNYVIQATVEVEQRIDNCG
jgi:sporulation protein YqfD